MIKEIVEFVNTNKGIEQYIDAKIDGIFIYLKYENDKFTDIKIIKSKYGNFNYFKLNSLRFSNKIDSSFLLKNNNLDNLFDIEEKSLETDIKRILYYAKIYSKGKNNNFQPFNKIKSLDSTSPFFMKIPFDFDGKISFYKKEKSLNISENINAHISKAMEYIDDNNEYVEFLKKMKDKLQLETKKIKHNFILKQLLQKELNNKKDKDILTQETIYLCIDVGRERQLQFDDYYLQEKAFNKKRSEMRFKTGKCNCCMKENVSLSAQFLFTNYDNTFAYKNIGLDYNFTVCQECAIALIKFWELAKQNISNPLPLIIYKNKNNLGIFGETFKVLDEKELPKNYHNVIKEIYYKNPKSLKNYYLFNFKFEGPQKKLFPNDIDYIENFEYITNFILYNFMENFNHKYRKTAKELGDLEGLYRVNLSVFQFEKIVSELIFEDKLLGNYFTDYKKLEIPYSKIKSKNQNSILKNHLIKYRQNFYDFIYKSHKDSLDLIDFRDMIVEIIVDNIRHDKNKDGYSIYEGEIKEKLNLLFSWKHNFNKKEKQMDSGEFIKLKKKMRDSLGYWQEVKNEDNEIKNKFINGVDYIEVNDDNNKFFAFLCGQFARFLLNHSKAKKENQSHSDFSGFLDWHNSSLLKSYIFEIFKKYAHEISYNSNNSKVENTMSIIGSYNEIEMDKVQEYLISGYFADNYFYEKTEKIQKESEDE